MAINIFLLYSILPVYATQQTIFIAMHDSAWGRAEEGMGNDGTRKRKGEVNGEGGKSKGKGEWERANRREMEGERGNGRGVEGEEGKGQGVKGK